MTDIRLAVDNAELDRQIMDHDRKPARPQPAPAFRPAIRTRNVWEFMNADFPQRQTLLTPWLPASGIAMCYAPRGGCKTHLALGTAWAVVTGTKFWRWSAPQPRRVLLIDGEMPRTALQDRIKAIARCSVEQPIWDDLQIAASDDQEYGLPDLADPEAQRTYYAPLVEKADLIIADNLGTLCQSVRENEADSWQPMQEWVLSMRRQNKTVLIFHHAGKSGAQRGTSKKEDVMDTVIALRKPPDFSPSDGARCEVHFEKNRGFYGADAEPFEARLVGEKWELSEIKASDDIEALMVMKKSGMSVRDIADRVGLSKSTVARKLGIEAE